MTPSIDLLGALRQQSCEDGRPRPGESLVVGFSGGADSVALVDLLDRWMHEGDDLAPGGLLAAHLDHALREESAADLEFCRQFCESRGIDFVSERVDVGARASSSGMGIEAAGRSARYDFLDGLRRRRAFDRVATAHHLDDHLETLFLWLGRGSGLAALAGIEASTADRVRPLRAFRREQLREYLGGRGLTWREDATNSDPRRRRNRVRAELLPVFEEIFGRGSGQRLGRFAGRAAGDRRALRAAAQRILEELRRPGPEGALAIDRAPFASLEESLQLQVLRAVAAEIERPERSQRWNEEHLRRVLRYVHEGASGQDLDLPEGGRLALDRERLTFWPGPAESDSDASGAQARWILHEDLLPVAEGQVTFLQQGPSSARPAGAAIGESPSLFEASFDADRIHGPLRLRSLREGDRMQPLGMQGHKKIRRLLAEHGVERHRRAGQLVVEDTERVVWAVGLTTCHEARIRASTRSVLRLRVEPELPLAKQQGKDPGS